MSHQQCALLKRLNVLLFIYFIHLFFGTLKETKGTCSVIARDPKHIFKRVHNTANTAHLVKFVPQGKHRAKTRVSILSS